VRELQNIIERIVVLKTDDTPIQMDDLPSCIVSKSAQNNIEETEIELPDLGLNLNEALAGVEMRLTLNALQRVHGNKARAAALLGLKRTTLVERLKKLNIETH
jgi:two-component system response regulator AtoC